MEPNTTDKKEKLLWHIDILNDTLKNVEAERNNTIERLNQEYEKNLKLNKKIQKLTSEIKNKDAETKKLKDEIQRLSIEVEELKNKLPEIKIKNERNAGRKTIITDELIRSVESFRKAGFTQKEISELSCVSVATVNKILNS